MNERVVVAQANNIQLADLVRSHVVRVTKPQSDQAITLDLNNGDGAKLDLSAVAHEKMTLVHVDTKLVIMFDNQSTVTAEPFFDLSGKPLASLNVELSAGRTLDGEQFAQSVPITDDQSVLPANDPSSGADFRDVSIDSLPGSMSPLALMTQEMPGGHGSFSGDFGMVVPVQQTFGPSTIAGSAPGIVDIPAPGGAGTLVFEAGLLASRGPGESDGTHAGNPAFQTTTRAGTINFTSPDGVESVALGGNSLNGTPMTFPDGTTGSLTAWFTFDASTGTGAIHYSYALLDNTVGISNASFAVDLTDPDGDHNPPANLVIGIIDDAPTAVADTDAFATGQTTAETGNVITGNGTTSGFADVSGADGGLTVVGVAAGNALGGANPGTVGVAVVGAFGTLTLNADGSYSYTHTGVVGGGTDVFTYTIEDADGSLAHATLTIVGGDSAPGNIVVPPAGQPDTSVFEAGLGPRGAEPAGSHAGDPSFPTSTQAGIITFTSPDGVATVELGNLTLTNGTPQTFTDATGSLTASFIYNAATGQGAINYSYTLLDNTLVNPSAVNFAVAVTDLDGDRTPGGNLTITIADDAPLAIADTDAVLAGQLTAETGNVLTGVGTASGVADVQGADGSLQVLSVAIGNTAVAVNPAGNATIAGAFGTLTLAANGSYSYARANGVPGGNNHSDTFTYTMQDADGSQSTATLTIAVADSSPGNITIPPPDAAETTVFEAGLPARVIGGLNEPAGSNPLDQTTAAGTIDFTSPDGVQMVELGTHTLTAVPQTFVDATGSLTASFAYDAATGRGTISYSYTLLDNTLADPSNKNFAVVVSDLDGDINVSASLAITIVDDRPTANPDTDFVAAGQFTAETGNVFSGAGTTSSGADVPGADGGMVIVGVAKGLTNIDLNDPTTLGGTHGNFGTLTIVDGFGSYAYVRDPDTPGGATETFTYTIRDNDGSLSHTALSVVLGDSAPGNIVFNGGSAFTLFEAGIRAEYHVGSTDNIIHLTGRGAIGQIRRDPAEQ
jgi:VCBS repeat-containing protein